jgi:hypothetical protein
MATSLSTNGRKKISTFKTEFSIKFPYLTIQFLDSKRKEFDQDLNLATVRSKKGNDISISGQNKINSLESKFEKILGVSIEVCYSKAGKLVRTKSNNDKTLSELNKWCENNGCDLLISSAKFRPKKVLKKKSNSSKQDNSITENSDASNDDLELDEIIKALEAELHSDLEEPTSSLKVGDKVDASMFIKTAKIDFWLGEYKAKYIKEIFYSDDNEKYLVTTADNKGKIIDYWDMEAVNTQLIDSYKIFINENETEVENEDELVYILPQNALDLVACVYILKYYYLSLNQDKKCSDNFDDEFSKLFVLENFSNDENLILKEIKEHFKNNTIDELITSAIAKADSLYDKKYETHNDFLIDLYNYISYFDLLDDSVFQSKFLSANIEIGNKLSEIANSGDQIKPQDRYLVIQIALMNWYNIKNEGFDINKVLKKVKYNLTAGSLLKYATREEDLTLMEKAALAVYNVILLDEDGLEIKNKDIFRAKQLIADFFNFEKKIEGLNVATMLKGSLNNSGKDDLSALIGGFEDNYCFDVMQFFNCTFAISKFRNRCIDLFKDSYKEINETYGGYIEDAIEEAQFDAEDVREEKIVSLYHDAINEDEDE